MNRLSLRALTISFACLAGCAADADLSDADESFGPAAQVIDGTSRDSLGGETVDLGKGDGSDVVLIGDSWMNLIFSGIQQSVVRLSKQPYRVYGVPGTQLLDGAIPGQYQRAKRANPNIKTVVMTGGGNDILITGLSADCAAGGTKCAEQLDKIGEGLRALWTQMASDGVRDVIHIQYSTDAGSGVKDGAARNALLSELCASMTPIRCHLLPTDDLVKGDLPDTIHPSPAAYDRIGAAVIALMEAKGMRR
ncbi:MAG: SGNH/GDSL hydrolase family protein [Polyangiales bacterium]